MFTEVMSLRDVPATFISGSLAFALVRMLETLAVRGHLKQLVCRKIVHISTGLLFVLTWPLFSAGSAARVWAAAVPALNGVRLILVAVGLLHSDGTIKAVSRAGSKKELLRGPILYIGVVVAVTLLFWRDSPISLLVLAQLCFGDGVADVVGRKYGTVKLPFNHHKSWAGSLAMLAGGGAASMAYIELFHHFGYYKEDVHTMMPVIWSTSLACTVVEALPIYQKLDDNLTVSVTAAAVGQLLI